MNYAAGKGYNQGVNPAEMSSYNSKNGAGPVPPPPSYQQQMEEGQYFGATGSGQTYYRPPPPQSNYVPPPPPDRAPVQNPGQRIMAFYSPADNRALAIRRRLFTTISCCIIIGLIVGLAAGLSRRNYYYNHSPYGYVGH
ncbi:hypothetical protein BX666DRAFT_1894818 [Dichotomocladium elegans]|nr:hypothetical protein BX666DRAFT_1894818 [Dichotomocladium elegans]